MPSLKRKFGDIGEEKAAEFLEKKGYRILDRNYRLKTGEIDIVAAKIKGLLGRKIETIVFVEVKTIKGEGTKFQFSLASQNVHYRKRQRLVSTAKIYLSQKRISPEICWRIDVAIVAIDPQSGAAKIDYLENAVQGK